MRTLFYLIILLFSLCACNPTYEVLHHAKGFYVDSCEVNYRSTNVKPSVLY